MKLYFYLGQTVTILVTMRAKDEGITPEATIKYHAEFKKCFDSLGF